jgi:hypothetical protein
MTDETIVLPDRAVGCGLLLRGALVCGVPPIGRCIDCERAFCATHQGYKWSGFREPFTNMCGECAAKREAKERQQREEGEVVEKECKEYIYSGRARGDLLAAGIPTIEMHKVRTYYLSGSLVLLRRGKFVDESYMYRRGWLLGMFSWRFVEWKYGESSENNRDVLTILLIDGGEMMVPVWEKNGEYVDIGWVKEIPKNTANLWSSHWSVAQAVRKLAQPQVSI